MSLRRVRVRVGLGRNLTFVALLTSAIIASVAHSYEIANMNFNGPTGLENPAIGPNGVLKGAGASISAGRLNLPNFSNPAEPTGRGLDLPLGPFAYAFSGAGDFQVDFDYQNNFNGIGGALFSADGSKYLYDHPELYDVSGDGQYIVDDDLNFDPITGTSNQAGSLNIYVGTNQFVGFSGVFADLWWLGNAGYTVAVPNIADNPATPENETVNFLDLNPHHISLRYTAATGEVLLTADDVESAPFIVQGVFGRDNSNAPLGFFRDTSHDIIRIGDENNPDFGNEISPLGYAGKFDNLVINGPLPPPVNLVVDRNTGSMTVEVISTFNPDRINSISILSTAGTLAPTNYLGVDASNPTFDPNDIWATSTQSGTQITETDGPGAPNDGAALINGQSFVVDNGVNGVWKPFFREDLKISVFDTTLGLELFGTVEYVGDKVMFGDLNLDGIINAQDYVVYRNGFDDNVAGLSFYAAYFLADLNGDGKHNFLDFNSFAEAFDAENGVGSFAAMIAGIPEPSSVVLLALGVGGLARTRVRLRSPVLARGFFLVITVNFCFSSTVQAAELVKYQFMTNFNDTSGNNRHGVPHPGEIFGQPPTVSGGKLVLTGDVSESLGVPLGAANPFGGEVDYTIEMKIKSAGSSFNPALGMVLFGSANTVNPTENDNHSLSIFVDSQATGGALVVDYFDVGAVRVQNALLLDNVEHSIIVTYDAPDDPGDPGDANSGTMYLNVDGNWRVAGSIAPRPPDIANHDVRIGSSLNTLYPFTMEQDDGSVQINTELEGTIDDFRILDVATIPSLLRAEVDLTTGEVTLVGGELPRAIRYYEITSAAGSLNPAGWNSLKDQNIDPVPPGTGIGERWDELIGSESQFAESFLLGSSLFDENSEISLGNAFTINSQQDLEVVAVTADLENIAVDVLYVNPPPFLPGDFNDDGNVDGRDFLIWQRGGSPTPLSAGDLADWRANYGTGGLAALAAVPEPGAQVLLVTSLVLIPTLRCRRRRVGSC